jgi:tetrahydromethanopterin S-methyltransferase subunit D
MAAVILSVFLHLLRFLGVPLAMLTFCGVGVVRAMHGERSILRILWRATLASVVTALVVCLLLSGLFAWMIHDFTGPNGEPPSG